MLISGTVSVAANSTSTNVLRGEQFEFLSRNMGISLRAAAAATGISLNFLVGGVSIAQGALVAPTNRTPILPDDFLLSVGGLRGERMFLTFANSTVGAIVVNFMLDLQ